MSCDCEPEIFPLATGEIKRRKVISNKHNRLLYKVEEKAGEKITTEDLQEALKDWHGSTSPQIICRMMRQLEAIGFVRSVEVAHGQRATWVMRDAPVWKRWRNGERVTRGASTLSLAGASERVRKLTMLAESCGRATE